MGYKPGTWEHEQQEALIGRLQLVIREDWPSVHRAEAKYPLLKYDIETGAMVPREPLEDDQ